MATNWFNGLPFENNPGENLCYCNSVTNGLLSSAKVKSKIRQDHCFCCDFLYGMYNADFFPPIKSARPLKALVAHSSPNFRSNRQQDCTEFANSVLEKRFNHIIISNISIQLISFTNYGKTFRK